MKFLKRLFLFLIVAVIALAVISQFLPPHFRFERNLIIRAGADHIHPLVSDLRRWPEWTVWNTETDPSLTFTYEGATEGVGAISKWESRKSGNGMLTITESDPATGIKFDLSFGYGRHTTKGWIRFAPAGTDTKVVWGLEGDVSRNPIDRWMFAFAEKLMAPDIEHGLARLKKKVETQ